MMLKKFQDDQYAWGSPKSWGIQKSSFFLKQSDHSCGQGPAVAPTILICLNAPQYFRNRIYQALHSGGRSSNQSISKIFFGFLPAVPYGHNGLDLLEYRSILGAEEQCVGSGIGEYQVRHLQKA
jgi:hypothetical protein